MEYDQIEEQTKSEELLMRVFDAILPLTCRTIVASVNEPYDPETEKTYLRRTLGKVSAALLADTAGNAFALLAPNIIDLVARRATFSLIEDQAAKHLPLLAFKVKDRMTQLQHK